MQMQEVFASRLRQPADADVLHCADFAERKGQRASWRQQSAAAPPRRSSSRKAPRGARFYRPRRVEAALFALAGGASWRAWRCQGAPVGPDGEWLAFLETWCRCPELTPLEANLEVVEWPRQEYQRFIDYFPVTRYRRDIFHYKKFGASSAVSLPSLLSWADWYLAPCPGPTQQECPSALGGLTDIYKKQDPTVVMMHPSRWNQLRYLCETQLAPSPRKARRVLVVVGSDQRLSVHEDKLDVFRPYFESILFEAKDVNVEGVSTMPMGLTEHYLRGVIFESASGAIQSACLEASGSCKSKSVLVPSSLSTRWGEYDVPKERQSAVEWALSIAGKVPGVNVKTIPTKEWWTELAKYKFLVSPAGNAVQSSKTLEALLVLTIPIVTRSPAHRDLLRYGFPIVVVGSWKEITKENLERWWEELSPRLLSFRKNCLTSKAYWTMLTSTLSYCE